MGSPDTEAERYPNEGPVHEVCPKAFELGKFEVTQAEWRQVMIYNRDPSQFRSDRQPVESVSWNEAKAFIAAMNIFGSRHYRLPSEAEWKYAARAGTTTAWYRGERAEDGCAYENIGKFVPPISGFPNCDDDRHNVRALVGSYKPNPWGLYDMLGNVAEWVEDCYVQSYRGAPRDGSAVRTEDCANRSVGGGAWAQSPRVSRAAYRQGFGPGNRSSSIGFRLARTITL